MHNLSWKISEHLHQQPLCLWRGTWLLTVIKVETFSGTPIKNGVQVWLLSAILLPTKLTIIEIEAHTKITKSKYQENALAGFHAKATASRDWQNLLHGSKAMNFLTQPHTSGHTIPPPGQQQFWKSKAHKINEISHLWRVRKAAWFSEVSSSCPCSIPYISWHTKEQKEQSELKGQYSWGNFCKATITLFNWCKTCETHNPG